MSADTDDPLDRDWRAEEPFPTLRALWYCLGHDSLTMVAMIVAFFGFYCTIGAMFAEPRKLETGLSYGHLATLFLPLALLIGAWNAWAMRREVALLRDGILTVGRITSARVVPTFTNVVSTNVTYEYRDRRDPHSPRHTGTMKTRGLSWFDGYRGKLVVIAFDEREPEQSVIVRFGLRHVEGDLLLAEAYREALIAVDDYDTDEEAAYINEIMADDDSRDPYLDSYQHYGKN